MTTNFRPASGQWETELDYWLPQLGHRNWVVIADSAYPFHSNPGITTTVTWENHLEVLRRTLAAIAACSHIRATVYTDAELKLVAEEDAPGVGGYRRELSSILRDQHSCELDHERIIARLDECGELFRIVVLKTTLTIPYTSVFLELDCGYWDAAAERRLRAAMDAQPTVPEGEQQLPHTGT